MKGDDDENSNPGLILVMTAGSAIAGEQWWVKGVKVLSDSQYHDSHYIFEIRYQFNEGDQPPPGNCGSDWPQGVGISMARTSGSPSLHVQAGISIALAAQAQDLPIDLFLRDVCQTSHAENGGITGNQWEGVRIHHQ